MSANFWYLDRDRTQRGPLENDEIVRLIGEGAISRETLIRGSGLADWTPASQIQSFASLFGPPPPAVPPSPAPAPESAAPYDRPPQPLRPALPVWGLLGRTFLFTLGSLLVIPSPWTSTSYCRWLCQHVALPDGTELTFTGKPGDIWYVFVIIAVVGWLGNVSYLSLAAALLTGALTVQIFKWFCANLESGDGRLRLSFEGGARTFIGWNVLFGLSVLTIIGWAWIIKLQMRWVCRCARGTARFEFMGSGLDILWRTLVAMLGIAVVIPIPWALRWYVAWWISQISTAPAPAALPGTV